MKQKMARAVKVIQQLNRILAVRAVPLITVAALVLFAGGIAMKTDFPTAAIVLGALLLLDITVSDLQVRRK